MISLESTGRGAWGIKHSKSPFLMSVVSLIIRVMTRIVDIENNDTGSFDKNRFIKCRTSFLRAWSCTELKGRVRICWSYKVGLNLLYPKIGENPWDKIRMQLDCSKGSEYRRTIELIFVTRIQLNKIRKMGYDVTVVTAHGHRVKSRVLSVQSGPVSESLSCRRRN